MFQGKLKNFFYKYLKLKWLPTLLDIQKKKIITMLFCCNLEKIYLVLRICNYLAFYVLVLFVFLHFQNI